MNNRHAKHAFQPMSKDNAIVAKLGETKKEFHLDTAEENKNAAIAMAEQASYSIDIFTQGMDTEIYNNKAFEQAVVKLVKTHANACVRILAQDSTMAAKNGHCLIRLAQTLTSSVFIHSPSQEHKDEQCAFMIVDKLGLLHRISASNRNYIATASFMSPQGAGKQLDYFNVIWEHSTPDVQTRRIYV